MQLHPIRDDEAVPHHVKAGNLMKRGLAITLVVAGVLAVAVPLATGQPTAALLTGADLRGLTVQVRFYEVVP